LREEWGVQLLYPTYRDGLREVISPPPGSV
jgi:hypothetical protein